MSVLPSRRTRVIVQGATGHQGRFHTRAMLDFGTKVVAGVTPGRGGQVVEGLPVFDSVSEAVKETGGNASVVFVPAPSARDAVIEAIDAGIGLIVVITERIPLKDAVSMVQYARFKGARIIGPNCPGIAVPGVAKLGIMPGTIFKSGGTGVVSRSGTLTYEIVNALSEAGIGQSACIGIGGDRVIGTSFIDVLDMFERDKGTNSIVLVGEIGGEAEEEAALYIRNNVKKPVVAYIAGRTAPAGKRMGHAGAIIARGRGTAESKIYALSAVGVRVATVPGEVPGQLRQAIGI
jgi:succinyl-CoA synthetase alpha subunit